MTPSSRGESTPRGIQPDAVIHAGVKPWFPGVLGRWRWLTEEVPAERLAALRIAVSLSLLLDILGTYLPYFDLFFSPAYFGSAEATAMGFVPGRYDWSLLNLLPIDWGPKVLMTVWLLASGLLLIGWRPALAAAIVFLCTMSFYNSAYWLNNGGDRLRNFLIITCLVGNTGAVWGVSSVRRGGDRRPVLVPGWPVKMILVQLAALYFFSGYYKIISPSWRGGYAMYWVAHELSWNTATPLSILVPLWGHQLLSWATLVWELGFPVLVLMPGTRGPTLAVGVFFHVLTLLTLEVGHFAVYALAAYVVFLPWERWRGGPGQRVDSDRGVSGRPG